MNDKRSLARKLPFREPSPRILILVEGKVTEPIYFIGVCRTLNLRSVKVTGPAGVPKTMVETAVAEKHNYDHIWCVFDTDSHPRLPDALQQARDNGIKVALSNPNFELFLLLHFVYYSRPCERREVAKSLVEYIPGYEKTFDFQVVWPIYETALANCQRLDNWHQTRGTCGEAPSTQVHNLIEFLRLYARL